LTLEAQQSRVDALVRLLGVIVLAFGIALVYYTYTNATSGIASEIITINYALGVLLLVAGGLAVISKFR
jgi:energy-converting hydrogenase Eha subunit E